MILSRHRHDYQAISTFEAGVVLVGNEVKSIVNKECDLSGSYVTIEKDGAWLNNAYVAPYDTPYAKFEPKRKRKLLLHKSELRKLKGETIIPLDFHLSDKGMVKISIAIARKNRNYDHRQREKEKTHRREMYDS